METHLNYRPYKCSHCSFASKKNIFVIAHINKKHSGLGKVLIEKDSIIEKK